MRGPYFKLQCWENGKNCTRYIPPAQVPLLREALAGQARFPELVQQYTQLVIAETREQLTSILKKKTARVKSAWPKTRKSSS